MSSSSETDQLLVERIRTGNGDAWEDLISRYEGRLLAFVESRVGRRAASEDIVQEAFIGFLNSLPNFDDGLSGLLRALESKSLLESTVVFVSGEFGRTPKINQRGGRDHYPQAMFCIFAGGGIQGGQVIGASDSKGEAPLDRVISPDDVAATFYHALGIDHTKEYHMPTGRPVVIVRHGKLIPELT